MKTDKIPAEQLTDTVTVEVKNVIGNLHSLPTENKTDLMSAINEVYGKNVISDAIGDPLLATDSYDAMGEKIDEITAEYKRVLTKLGATNSELLNKKLNDFHKWLDENILFAESLPSETLKNSKKGIWVTVGEFTQPTVCGHACVNDDYYYQIGGYQSSISTAYKAISRMDIKTGVVRNIDISQALINGLYGQKDNKCYIAAGTTGSTSTSVNNLRCFDMQSETITELAAMTTTARQRLSGGIIGNVLYAFGGNVGTTNHLLSDAYDISTNTWTKKTNLTVAMTAAASCVIGEKIIVRTTGKSTYLLDVATDTWSQLSDAPSIEYGHKLVNINGRVLSIGGASSESTSNPTMNKLIEIYNFSENKWEIIDYAPMGIRDFTVISHDDNVFIACGSTDNALSATTRSAILIRYIPNPNMFK